MMGDIKKNSFGGQRTKRLRTERAEGDYKNMK